jgi:hypothetical protein
MRWFDFICKDRFVVAGSACNTVVARIRVREHAPNDQAQRPPPETPGRLQQSLTNWLNHPPAQRGGGSLQHPG